MKTQVSLPGAAFIWLALASCLVLGPTKGLAQLDFGDAPDTPYPTLLASDGARHTATGPVLGFSRDTEGDGQPNTSATGDDIVASFDEDGVFFPTVLFPGFGANTVTVTTSGTGPYILNAWMDFDGNGSWADAGEQIFVDVPLVAGANVLTFPVPAVSLPNRVYSRWRLNTVGGLSYDGAAVDGEVEDYCHGSVHGQKWHDRNANGKRDPNEEGLNGYQIQLWDFNDTGLMAFVGTHDMDHDGTPGINPITERGVYWMHGVPPGFFLLREKFDPNAFQTFPAKCGSKEYRFRMNCEVRGRTPPEQPPVCGNEIDWVDNCPPGIDEMFTVAQVMIQTPPAPPFDGAILPLFASGPTAVERQAPTPGPGASIQTEMLSMDLIGFHPDLGGFHLRAGGDQGLPGTPGQIQEPLTPGAGDFHVDSFFDVFFEIEVPGAPPGQQTFRLENPIQVAAEGGIHEVPPIGANFITQPGPPLPLLIPPYGPTDLSGFSLVSISHKTLYGLDFGNKITNAKRKSVLRRKCNKIKKKLKLAKRKGQRAKIRKLTRDLRKCLRALKRL